ncbi:SGNH/GDSL hydrolase family protein [Blastopirellula marina]|nr:SGNH/GDSL hydrolase family protein [Blastopirellula marina]
MKTVVAACTFCFVCCFYLPHSFGQQAAGDTIRVMPLGDSITHASDPGYRGFLFHKLKAAGYAVDFVGTMKDQPANGGDPDHEGHGGFSIGPGPSKADAWSNGRGNLFTLTAGFMQEQPDVILVLLGVNDYFNVGDLQPNYVPDQQGPARLANFVAEIHRHRPETKVLVSTLLPVKFDANFAQKFNDRLPAALADHKNVTVVDLNRAVGFVDGDWQADGLHLSESGNKKLADAWFHALKDVLNDK